MGDIRNYENLANAIILQAVRDYRMALKCLKRNPGDRDAQADGDEIERFSVCSGTRLSRMWMVRS